MTLNTIVLLLNFDLILLALLCCKCFECVFSCYDHVSIAKFSRVQLSFVIFVSANTLFLLSVNSMLVRRGFIVYYI